MARHEGSFSTRSLFYAGNDANWLEGQSFAGFLDDIKDVKTKTGEDRRVINLTCAGRVDDTVRGIGVRGKKYGIFTCGLLEKFFKDSIPDKLEELGLSHKEKDVLIILEYLGKQPMKKGGRSAHTFSWSIDDAIFRQDCLGKGGSSDSEDDYQGAERSERNEYPDVDDSRIKGDSKEIDEDGDEW